MRWLSSIPCACPLRTQATSSGKLFRRIERELAEAIDLMQMHDFIGHGPAIEAGHALPVVPGQACEEPGKFAAFAAESLRIDRHRYDRVPAWKSSRKAGWLTFIDGVRGISSNCLISRRSLVGHQQALEKGLQILDPSAQPARA